MTKVRYHFVTFTQVIEVEEETKKSNMIASRSMPEIIFRKDMIKEEIEQQLNRIHYGIMSADNKPGTMIP
jgi:hypothetical protein